MRSDDTPPCFLNVIIMMPNMRRYITLLILSAATLLQAQTVKSVRLVEDAASNDRHAPSYE